jgi:hypothetical protein
MKTLLVLALSIALAACGGGETPNAEITSASTETVSTHTASLSYASSGRQAPSNERTVTEPTVEITASITAPIEVSTIICPQSTDCKPLEPLPVRNVATYVTDDSVCKRDNNPLVDMGNYLVDNCGNKYGKI